MAVVEVIHRGSGLSGSVTSKYRDASVVENYAIRLDAQSRDMPTILNQAKLFAPTLFPGMGQAWISNPSYGLYAKRFEFRAIGGLFYNYDVDVHHMALDPQEPNTEGNDNPLMWPATYSLEYVEYEEAVSEAWNLVKIGPPGQERQANTLGPVQNGALQEFEEALTEVTRDPVLHIHKNVPTLQSVINYNLQYARTTNSDNFLGAGPRRCKFLGADASGQLTANGFTYYPMTIRIQIMKTTDRTLNNIGWHYWKQDAGTTPENATYSLIKAMVDEVDAQDNKTGNKVPASEPIFLTPEGYSSWSTGTVVKYRTLDLVSYAGLNL